MICVLDFAFVWLRALRLVRPLIVIIAKFTPASASACLITDVVIALVSNILIIALAVLVIVILVSVVMVIMILIIVVMVIMIIMILVIAVMVIMILVIIVVVILLVPITIPVSIRTITFCFLWVISHAEVVF
jgi:hypothetical protein